MRIEYCGPYEAVWVNELDAEVRKGEMVDVPAELGQRMLAQPANWRQAKPAKGAKEE